MTRYDLYKFIHIAAAILVLFVVVLDMVVKPSSEDPGVLLAMAAILVAGAVLVVARARSIVAQAQPT